MRTVFVDHAAEILGVSRRTVYYWIRAGRLRTERKPNRSRRVVIESIEALLCEVLAERVQRSARRAAERGRRIDRIAS